MRSKNNIAINIIISIYFFIKLKLHLTDRFLINMQFGLNFVLLFRKNNGVEIFIKTLTKIKYLKYSTEYNLQRIQ
jgi:hypothetical protein